MKNIYLLLAIKYSQQVSIIILTLIYEILLLTSRIEKN
jgi:hypothetical protein